MVARAAPRGRTSSRAKRRGRSRTRPPWAGTAPAAETGTEEQKQEEEGDFPTQTEIFDESGAFSEHGSLARPAVPLPDPEPEPEEDDEQEDTDTRTLDEMSEETGTCEDTDVDAPTPEPPTLRDAAASGDESTDTGTVGEFDEEDES